MNLGGGRPQKPGRWTKDRGGYARLQAGLRVQSQGGSCTCQNCIRPPQPLRNSQFKALASWEGAVLEVVDTHFVAEVIDLQTDERAIAEFEWSDISSSDRPLCEPGALFYWSVGYEIKESGQRSRASIIRFRRLAMGHVQARG